MMLARAKPPHRAARPPHRRRAPIERRVHCAIADLLRRGCAPDWIWFHVPNGEYRAPETVALLSRLGVLAGVFDLCLISPSGAHHWLELKRDWRAPLSIDQLRFRRELERRNIPHAIARSFDEAVDQLQRWGALQGVHVQ